MGQSSSKRKRNSDRFSAARDSWVIRFYADRDVVESDHDDHDNNRQFRGCSLAFFDWQCPDCIPKQHSNKLIVMVMQTYLQRNCETIINLIKQPLYALDLIDQCDTFLKSSHQDIAELEKELINNENENFYLCIDNKQLCYLDLLIDNHFDYHYELRNVLRSNFGRKPQSVPESEVPVPEPPQMSAPLEPTAPYEPTEFGEILVDYTKEHHLPAEGQSDSSINVQDGGNCTTTTTAFDESLSVSMDNHSNHTCTKSTAFDESLSVSMDNHGNNDNHSNFNACTKTTNAVDESLSVFMDNHSNHAMLDNQDSVKKTDDQENPPNIIGLMKDAATSTEEENKPQHVDNNGTCSETSSSCAKIEKTCQSTQTDTEPSSTDTDDPNKAGETSAHPPQSRNEPIDDTNKNQDSCRKNEKYTYPTSSNNAFILLHGLSHSIYKRRRANQDVLTEPERKRHKQLQEQPSISRSDDESSTNE